MNIRELRGKFNLTQNQLAEGTGIPRTRIAKWEQGKGSPKMTDSKVLQEFFADMGTNSHKETASNKITRFQFSGNTNKFNSIPVYNTRAFAGLNPIIQDHPELIIEYVDIPFIGKADGVIEISGESMYPTYKNGTRIAVRKLEDKQLVYYGECYYIIDKNFDGKIKRLFAGRDPEHLILKSDNDKFPDIEWLWENVISVCKILCRIIKD
jgi:DNA-binding XRE family transcriptional regulator